MEKKKFKLQIPNTFVLLLFVILAAAVLTYIIPAGQYDVLENGSFDPTSYHVVASNPTTFTDLLLAIPEGIASQSTVIVMLLLSVGGIEILNETKAINAGIMKFIVSHKNADIPVLIVLALIFACLGSFAGWNIECVPFIPIVCAIVRAMGYNNMLGLYVVSFPAAAGWSTGVLNLFSTAYLQQMAGLPVFSGLGMRIVSFVIFVGLSIAFILGYAKKYRKENNMGAAGEAEIQVDEDLEFTPARKVSLVVAIAGIITIAYCACNMNIGWSLPHVGGFWVILGIVLAFINRMSVDQAVGAFTRGVASIAPVAVIIGMATAALVLLEKASLMHTIIYYMATALESTPKALVGVLIFVFLTLMNFLITGVHGKAAILMPILVPLAEILGVSQQVVVLAFIFGDGFSNWFWPTSAIGVASAGAANVTMSDWIKESWKKFVLISVIAAVIVFVASVIGY